jgi:hypothetical protein
LAIRGGGSRRIGIALAGEGNPNQRKRTYDPKTADTLFNLGIVKWQGKQDEPGAVTAWMKLLEANAAYPDKDAVLQLMAQAQQRSRSIFASGNVRLLVFRLRGNPPDERPRD